MEFKYIKGKDMGADPSQKFLILDVRTIAEHEEKRLSAPHILTPLDQLDGETFINEYQLSDNATPVYILCRIGRRAEAAAGILAAAGFTNSYVIEGGILDCEATGVALHPEN
jgi:rhodanese-related sulfurtransferase